MTVAPLRGFRDYPPPEAGARSGLFERLRSAARRCGFVEFEAPSIESVDLFKVKSGDEIVEELWAFSDKGGRPVALAAESTPSLARLFASRAKSEPLPAKWFTLAKLWRYEEPQSGRTREFSQFNLDILGVPGLEAEAELLGAAAQLLDAAGASGLYVLRINDRPLSEGLGRRLGARDLPRYLRALDRFHKSSPGERRRELAEAGLAPDALERLEREVGTSPMGLPPAEATARLDELMAGGLEPEAAEGAARLRRLFGLLEAMGLSDRVTLDLTIVRGFAYYTSTVFEAFDREGTMRALLGGGRYDRLVELFGGPPTPACGLALGDQTLELLLRRHERWPEGERPIDTYVVTVAPELQPVAFEIVARLRSEGISADLDLMGRPMARQLREAARRKARRALLVGPKELSRGMVLERELTTGAQRELPRSSPGGGGSAPPAPA